MTSSRPSLSPPSPPSIPLAGTYINVNFRPLMRHPCLYTCNKKMRVSDRKTKSVTKKSCHPSCPSTKDNIIVLDTLNELQHP